MPAFNEPKSTVRIWLWTTVVVILVSLALAPVLTSTTCYDAVDPALTRCETSHLGFAGNPTHLVAWLAAVASTVLVGWMVARRSRANRST